MKYGKCPSIDPKKGRTAKVETGLILVSGVTQVSSLRSINKNHKQDACDTLITYFRRGKLQKFFKVGSKNAAEEMDFISASKMKEFSGRSQDLSDIAMLRKVRKYLEEENG